ncbi:8109_t:CDS:1 [Ambispora leptoticha]|uniref:8109_t:CDS:1 n=1 Tax=Ambispora leptoticha TaxID=144679 RepID=A0A9N8Z941_9GLOM|nr:8109_t:CDS:1 [Ambispora leptoticha]
MEEKELLSSNYLAKNVIINNTCYITRSHPREDPQGCYVLNKNSTESFNGLANLNLSDPYRDKDEDLMDPGFCVNLCTNFLFKYAALGNGTDCRCGTDDSLTAYTKLNDTDSLNYCNITCVGNTTDICGGKEAYTVYDITNELPSYKVPTIANDEKLALIHNLSNNSRYIGCIQDSPLCDQRILNGTFQKLPDMTVDKCIDSCGKDGFKYAGLEIGDECYCAMTYKPGIELKPEECSSSCPGNNFQLCGGPLSLSIYEVPQMTPTPSHALMLGLSLGLGIPVLLLLVVLVWRFCHRKRVNANKNEDFIIRDDTMYVVD